MSKKFLAVFLHSNQKIRDPNLQDLYEKTRQRINDTTFLKKHLHVICIDNKYCHSVLKKNKITEVPIFVLMENGIRNQYHLEDADRVFDIVHRYYIQFYKR